MHDFNPGIRPSGLFWIAQIPDSAVAIQGERVRLDIDGVPVVDDIAFLGGGNIPARINLHIGWTASGPMRQVRATSLNPTDPFSWSGELRLATATGTISGSNSLGFSFLVSPLSFFGELGTERNGFFLH